MCSPLDKNLQNIVITAIHEISNQ